MTTRILLNLLALALALAALALALVPPPRATEHDWEDWRADTLFV